MKNFFKNMLENIMETLTLAGYARAESDLRRMGYDNHATVLGQEFQRLKKLKTQRKRTN